MLPTGPAVVLVMDPPMDRVAAHVYRLPDGIGWMEPGYYDEMPHPRPQWHQFAGKLTDTDNGILLHADKHVILVLDLERVREEYPDVVREIAELKILLRERGTTLEEQRIFLALQVGAVG